MLTEFELNNILMRDVHNQYAKASEARVTLDLIQGVLDRAEGLSKDDLVAVIKKIIVDHDAIVRSRTQS